MSDWVNGNWSDEPQSQAPVHVIHPSTYQNIQVPQTPQPPSEFKVRELVLIGIVLLLVAVVLMGRMDGRSDDGKRPDVKVDRLHFLILEESADRGDLTSAQQAVIASVPLREEVKRLGGHFRVIDRDDIPQLETPWKEMAQSVTERIPVVVIATPKDGGQFPVKDVDSTLAKLRLVAGGK